ncbi:hypothetical protein GIB67_015100 [Kingdonia uniflora]|uniref:Uncharacterized protein n=1 Tax=Kingdonia uniflora TaxID=39325 RepID=A0A7J7LJB3_9MAGN|nr:hypothetical protein GIB67_015100 [Kingdonia uniflora]
MGRLSLKLMLVFSLSITVSSSSSFLLHRHYHHKSHSFPLKSAKSTAKDLLSLLGTKDQASKINTQEAQQLKSCLKFLVPFTPNTSNVERIPRGRREAMEMGISSGKSDWVIENELVWWPPEAVMELARISVDSGGDPAAIQRALDPTALPVPDVEGSKEKRCELTRTPYGRRFVIEELNSYLAFLFELIAARGPSVGLNVSLDRYDLFHGHLFLATDSGRLGILFTNFGRFHAKEYPAYDKDVFPYNMGYCQIGSNLAYDDAMNLRNILWLAPLPNKSSKDWVAPGVLVVLDGHPEGIVYRELIPEYVDYVRTIYEDDFGDVAVDVNYLNVGETVANYSIFIC